ncbi:MAG TPA: 2-dehydropantoate 2-reductase, partial [Gammaproteobacteria bacterium]
RANGLRVDSVLGDMHVEPAVASANTSDVGPVDVVLLGVKTWQVPEAARSLGPLLHRDTVIVPLQNGVETIDELVSTVGPQHVAGGVCGGFCFIVEPGRIRHIGGVTFIKFGELDGRKSRRIEALRDTFVRASVDAAVPDDIQVAVWEKFLLVVPFGGVGAATRAPIGVLLTPPTRDLLARGMREIEAIGRARGIALPADTVERTLAILDGVTPSGTSSLQRDIAAGKRSELDAWTGAVVRLGARAGVPTPLHDFLYATLLPQERRARGEVSF